jgi:hypothetical protein
VNLFVEVGVLLIKAQDRERDEARVSGLIHVENQHSSQAARWCEFTQPCASLFVPSRRASPTREVFPLEFRENIRVAVKSRVIGRKPCGSSRYRGSSSAGVSSSVSSASAIRS